MQQTQHSILHNLVYQICSPPACVAHVILHFLQADNCPHVKGDDPDGEVVVPLKEYKVVDEYFSSNELFPDNVLIIHKVDSYEIGSE